MNLSLTPQMPRPRGARRRNSEEHLQEPSEKNTFHGFVRSFDDTRIFYSIEGEGRPLIFCYGLVCSSLHWTYQIDHFRRTHKAIWSDYRGHQNSDTPRDPGTLTIENIARDLDLLLDELKVKDAVLLGHSMGVNIVLELYRRRPERVAGMVLANGTAKRPLETLFHVNAFSAGFRALSEAYKLSPSLVQNLWKLQKLNPLTRTLVSLGGFNPHLTPREDIELYIEQVAAMDPGILIQLIRSYESYDATAWLHTIQAPTLILAGQEDHMIPLEQQSLMKQLIPNSSLEVIRHGSHCPQMDLPELVNHKIENFLRELDYR